LIRETTDAQHRDAQHRDAQLEAEADRLLRSARAGRMAGQDRQYPFYTEQELRRKLARDQSRVTDRCVLSQDLNDPEFDLQSLAAEVKLTKVERRVLNLTLNGFSQPQISEKVHLAQQRVSELLHKVLDKIRRHLLTVQKQDLSRSIRQIYWQEAHRHLYRPPQHCAGQPCRRLRRRFNVITRKWEWAHFCPYLRE